MVDIPHHIANPPSIQRHVQVVGGTNWDLSRSAVQTPIQQLPEPEPIRVETDSHWEKVDETLPAYTAADRIPASTPTSVRFNKQQSTIAKNLAKQVQALSKKRSYVVVGHASKDEAGPSKLSWARANEVAKLLRKSGHRVALVKAFGADRPADKANETLNARVEVYPTAK